MQLSIVVMVGSRRERGQRVIDEAAASAADCSAEIIVCDFTPGERPLALPLRPPTRVLPVAGASLGRARAAAARAARGRLVAYLEDHCYPQAGWARALCARADEGWAAIGYGFVNANPATRASRALALVEYGAWLVPAPRAREATMLGGNNVSYARAALIALGREADELLDADWVLQRVLCRRGDRLLFEPAAVVAHEQFERVGDSSEILSVYGMLAVRRQADSQRWTPARRLLHVALAVPLTPVLRVASLLRLRPDLATRVVGSLPRMIPPMLATAVGEVRGAIRPGRAAPAQRFAALELELARAAP